MVHTRLELNFVTKIIEGSCFILGALAVIRQVDFVKSNCFLD